MKVLLFLCLSSISFYFGLGHTDIAKHILGSNESNVMSAKVNVFPASYRTQTVSDKHINALPSKVSMATIAPKIWVDNTTLHKSETLNLHFLGSNPPYLGVINPDGHFFYVVFPSEYSLGALQPVVESKDFVNLKIMRINPQTFKADPYRYGVYTNLPVFTKSGKYTFIMGDNLHVHDPKLLDKVEVQYQKN
jgi:hypothetical protein